MRFILPFLMALLVAAPALALDLTAGTAGRVIFDSDCTDTESLPATTRGSILDESTWDSVAEALDPDVNLKDAVQTTGSADGWCDDFPSVIAGTFTLAGNEDLVIGPITYSPNVAGFYFAHRFTTIRTDYQFVFAVATPWATTLTLDLFRSAALTDIGSTFLRWFGQVAESSTGVVDAEEFAWPTGPPVYMIINLDGTAGTWVLDLATFGGRVIGRK